MTNKILKPILVAVTGFLFFVFVLLTIAMIPISYLQFQDEKEESKIIQVSEDKLRLTLKEQNEHKSSSSKFWTFLSFCNLIPFILCVFICLVIMFIVPFVYLRGYLNFLQVFVTTKPSDTELIVAIEGLKSFEEMEKNWDVKVFKN